jgi:hypothetical protein
MINRAFRHGSAEFVFFSSLLKSRTPNRCATKAAPQAPLVRYEILASGPAELMHLGIPLDEVEDLLLESAAYGGEWG